MKRDIELIRKILLEVEKDNSPTSWITIVIENYPEDQISYHVKLLTEAGLSRISTYLYTGTFI